MGSLNFQALTPVKWEGWKTLQSYERGEVLGGAGRCLAGEAVWEGEGRLYQMDGP